MLQWFVLRTLVGKEEKFILLFKHLFHDIKIVFPKRRVSWRKKGKVIDVIKPLFSGYLFISANNEKIKELNQWLRFQKVDAWFIKFDNVITPINDKEMQLIQQLMCNGDVVERSEVIKIGEKI